MKARLIEALGLQSPKLRGLKPSNSHYSFSWKHPHSGWFASSAPDFIDLEDIFFTGLKWDVSQWKISGM